MDSRPLTTLKRFRNSESRKNLLRLEDTRKNCEGEERTTFPHTGMY